MSGAISELPEQEVLSGVLIPQELSPLFNLFEKPEMKKSLIALAVMAASGASMAQVTLYGVADVAVGAANNAGGYIDLANDKVQALANGNLNNGNSRFGLKGTEKIGGLTAGFNYEASINLANGATGGSGGQTFARAANVSLAGGFGEIVIGRQVTTAFDAVASWELTGAANYSAVASQFGYTGSGNNNVARDDGAIKYNSPKFSGFGVSVMAVLEGNGFYKDAAGNNKGKYDLALTYANDKLAAALDFNKVTDVSENASLGAKYNFGMATVAASVHSQKAGANNDTVKEGYTLGVSAPIGAFTLTADVAQATKTYDVANKKDTGTKTNFLLEAKYALSKRTFVYGAFLRDGKQNDVATSKDVDGYSIGVRHNF
jgi:predicted porin